MTNNLIIYIITFTKSFLVELPEHLKEANAKGSTLTCSCTIYCIGLSRFSFTSKVNTIYFFKYNTILKNIKETSKIFHFNIILILAIGKLVTITCKKEEGNYCYYLP